MKRRILVGILLILMLVIVPAMPVSADTSDDVIVTVTPAYLTMTVSPDTWAPNDIVGDGVTPKGSVAPDTIYYANPYGDNVSPAVEQDSEGADTVIDGECQFTITNGSSVATNVTINFPDHSGGDASTNSNLGTNDTTKFGAYSYFSGATFSTGKVIAEASGSAVAKSNLGATTNILFGLMYETQSNAWASASNMSSTVNVALSYYMP
jgi:hypothetical protein